MTAVLVRPPTSTQLTCCGCGRRSNTAFAEEAPLWPFRVGVILGFPFHDLGFGGEPYGGLTERPAASVFCALYNGILLKTETQAP